MHDSMSMIKYLRESISVIGYALEKLLSRDEAPIPPLFRTLFGKCIEVAAENPMRLRLNLSKEHFDMDAPRWDFFIVGLASECSKSRILEELTALDIWKGNSRISVCVESLPHPDYVNLEILSNILFFIGEVETPPNVEPKVCHIKTFSNFSDSPIVYR